MQKHSSVTRIDLTHPQTKRHNLEVGGLALAALVMIGIAFLSTQTTVMTPSEPTLPLFIEPAPGVIIRFDDTESGQFEFIEMPQPLRQEFELAWAKNVSARSELSLSEAPVPQPPADPTVAVDPTKLSMPKGTKLTYTPPSGNGTSTGLTGQLPPDWTFGGTYLWCGCDDHNQPIYKYVNYVQ